MEGRSAATAQIRWAVRLYQKHTGNEITLGARYDTREEAEAHATDKYVCLRCNSVTVVPTEGY